MQWTLYSSKPRCEKKILMSAHFTEPISSNGQAGVV